MNIPYQLFRSFLKVLPLETRRKILYRHQHGAWPNLKDPRSFSEKLTWRIVNDRREVLAWTCDKLEMKARVSELCPSVNHIDTLWSGKDIYELIDFPFPDRWVLKPNHTSGTVYIGEGQPQPEFLARLTRNWLSSSKEQAKFLGEWAYSRAQPRILLEPWIGGASLEDVPNDYKFFVFQGKVIMVQVHIGRGVDHRQLHYSPDWEPMLVTTAISSDEEHSRPVSLELMLEQATMIGRDFDFMRVDFYEKDGVPYFGEVTPYPAGGLRKFTPAEFDLELGSHWLLPTIE